MFGGLKKKVAGFALVQGFESDLKGIKKAPFEDQKWVAARVLEDSEELDGVKDIKLLTEILQRKVANAKARRHLALANGSQNEQNIYYAEATLCEAMHMAQLLGDQSIFNSVFVPLSSWLENFIPSINADKEKAKRAREERVAQLVKENKERIAKEEMEARVALMAKYQPAPPITVPEKSREGDTQCPKCMTSGAIYSFLKSEAGRGYLKCGQCGMNFQY